MYIEQVELKNIGPHLSLTVKFDCGLVGIVGANGAGKSTLVNAIYAALTNDFSRLGSVKTDIITNGVKGESYIRVEGKHQNQSFVITRWLHPNKNEFKIGKAVFEKTTDVNEAVMTYLNISKTVIDKYVFVAQWEMFNFLDQTASERAKTFQYLCGTESASSLHKTCLDYVTKQQGIEVIDNRNELEESLNEAQVAIARHRATGQAAKVHIMAEEKLEAGKKLLASYGLGKEAQTQLVKTIIKIEALENCLARFQKSQSKVKFVRRKDWQAKFKGRVIAAQQLLTRFEDHRLAHIEFLEKAKEYKVYAHGVEILQRRKPLAPPHYVGLEEQKLLTKQRHGLEFQLKQIVSLDSHERYCTQCHQAIPEEHIANIKASNEKRKSDLAHVVHILDICESHDTRMSEYLVGMKACENICARVQNELTVAKETMDLIVADLKGFNAEHKDEATRLRAKNSIVEQQLVHYGAEVNKEEQRILGLQGELKSNLEQQVVLQQQVNRMPSVTKVAGMTAELGKHEESLLVWQQALGGHQEAKRSKFRILANLEQLTARLAAHEKTRKLLDIVSTAGDVFHWNNLPKMVSQANLQLLVGDINSNLQLFSNPFFVEADEDLTFKVFFAGQEAVKAKQLSGGQKVILSIAFRAALDRVFGHNIGMMFLDEPTSGLDSDNVSFFKEALQRLTQKVGKEHQLIVITHVQELGKVFDQLIEIKKG